MSKSLIVCLSIVTLISTCLLSLIGAPIACAEDIRAPLGYSIALSSFDWSQSTAPFGSSSYYRTFISNASYDLPPCADVDFEYVGAQGYCVYTDMYISTDYNGYIYLEFDFNVISTVAYSNWRYAIISLVPINELDTYVDWSVAVRTNNGYLDLDSIYYDQDFHVTASKGLAIIIPYDSPLITNSNTFNLRLDPIYPGIDATNSGLSIQLTYGGDSLYEYIKSYNPKIDTARLEGIEMGYDNGYSAGYDIGYNAGVTDSNNYTFSNLVGAVIDVPINTISSLLDFNLMGTNLRALVITLFSLALVIAVVRLIL